MKILAVIPARYASTRFPAKALADIGGKTMIKRVYEQVSKAKCLDKIVVATDHKLIFDHVKSFGGNVAMTSDAHQSGTDRCGEVLDHEREADYVINIQGDEPFIDPRQIELVASYLDGKTEIATLCKKITDKEALFSPNTVKLIFDKNGQAIYFSRHPIPFVRNFPQEEWLVNNEFYKHIGMYAYRSDILRKITTLSPSSLEKAESLEQLRWIENGYKIQVSITEIDSLGIDTPEDLENALMIKRLED